MNRLIRWGAAITLLAIAFTTGIVGAQARTRGPTEAALGPVDLYFVTQTSLGTPFQVDSGKVAREKGRTQAIRSYAQLMVSSHIAVNRALQAILERKGPVPPPTLLKAAYATILSTLRREAGRRFDEDYVRGQVAYQKANAALYQYEIENGSDADLERFAQETLPKILDHLEKALELERNACQQPAAPRRAPASSRSYK
jgi:putative membrane protein